MKKIQACILPVGALPEEDQKNFIEWVWRERKINMFDPDSLTHKWSAMCVAGGEKDPMLYIPLQPIFVWDAIASKPGITPRQEALCLWRIGQAVDEKMTETGIGEAWFVCKDDRVSDICLNHGFEEIKGVRLLRRKAKKEKPEENDNS